MEMLCGVQGCSNWFEFSCSCNSSIHLCENHCGSHMNTQGRHLLKSITSPINAPDTSYYISLVHSLLSSLNQEKSNLISLAADIYKSVDDIINENISKIDSRKSYIQALGTFILTTKRLYSDSHSQLSSPQVKLNINQVVSEINKELLEICMKLNKTEPIQYEAPVESEVTVAEESKSGELSNDILVYYNQTQHCVICIDLLTQKENAIQIKLEGEPRSACKISESMHFINNNNFCYFFNHKLKKTYEINTPKHIGYRVPVYHEDYVYLFGGKKYKSERLNLSSNTWEEIQQSPLVSLATIVGNSFFSRIFLAGKVDKDLFLYEVHKNCYVSICEIDENVTKCLGFGYIITPDRLVKINGNGDSLTRYKLKSQVKFSTSLECYTIAKFGDYIFFTDIKKKLIRVDTTNFELLIVN